MAKVSVNVAVIHEGKILLTRREDFEVWCLPSGGVEEGESLAEAAVREAREETGIEVELTRLVGVYSRLGGDPSVHAVLYAGRPVGGELTTQPGETIDVAYFPFGQLPDDLSFGQYRRIQDAIHGLTGLSVRQELHADEGKLSRSELYEKRDQSGLPRREFYLQYLQQAEILEKVEVQNES